MSKEHGLFNEFQESDLEVLKEYHEFIRDDEYDEENKLDWRIRLARRYYNDLFKEFAIIDLSHYSAGLIGFRWRIEEEVMSGKGQEFCAAINCSITDEIKVFEVPFGYEERGESKAELVKVALCKKCAKKLKYYQEKQNEDRLTKTGEISSRKKQKH